MFKVNEKSIGNYNLIGTFLVLVVFVFVVMKLSIDSKIDDFEIIEKDIKNKFIEDKKGDIKFKINNIHMLIESLNEIEPQEIQKNKIFMREFIGKINNHTDENIEIIKIEDIDKNLPYYEEFVQKSEYYKYNKDLESSDNSGTFTIEYFFLNKTFGWIITTKFKDNIMNKEIQNWKKGLDTLVLNNIYVHISILFFFSIALLLVIYVINKFANKTIAKCRESIKVREKSLKQTIIALQKDLNNESKKYHAQKELIQDQTKMLALSEMLANLSHQWRQPLSDISQTVKSVECKITKKRKITEDDIEKLRHIDNSALYLARAVDDFRVFLKADSLKIDFNVIDIIEKALSVNESIIDRNSIQIIKEYDENIIIHNLSFGLLQALVNIIYNSKDALKKMQEEDRYIFIKTQNSEESVEITLTDTGNGITNEVMKNIFQPYFTTKQKTYGTGLGLHMAYNIIERNMTGKITVKNEDFEYNSKSYRGASFSIILYLDEKKD